MQDLIKVNGSKFLDFWKNLMYSLLVVMAVLFLSKLLPYYFSPIVALIGAAVLYTILFNGKLKSEYSCMIMPYSLFYCMILYSFVLLAMNVLYIWGMIELPKELTFFTPPYIPALILDPVCAVTLGIVLLRKNSLALCVDCRFDKGSSMERGQLGTILHYESGLLLKNLFILFVLLSIVVWGYYLTLYDRSADINARDTYIFTWINLVTMILYLLFFAARYYNIYLDLKESGNIITEQELNDMSVKTYLRFYVICGNSMYLSNNIVDPKASYREVIDTPFVTKRNVNGITNPEVERIVHRLTDVDNGKLRFFFGRRNPDLRKHILLRYFYFLQGKPEDYSQLNLVGEWMDFDRIKSIYSKNASLMSTTLLADISRMTTVVLTQKLFDERGFRKVKIKSYQPGYSLEEVRDNDYDFQSDKWIKIAMFNSDSKGFFMRRLWKKMVFKDKNNSLNTYLDE